MGVAVGGDLLVAAGGLAVDLAPEWLGSGFEAVSEAITVHEEGSVSPIVDPGLARGQFGLPCSGAGPRSRADPASPPPPSQPLLPFLARRTAVAPLAPPADIARSRATLAPRGGRSFAQTLNSPASSATPSATFAQRRALRTSTVTGAEGAQASPSTSTCPPGRTVRDDGLIVTPPHASDAEAARALGGSVAERGEQRGGEHGEADEACAGAGRGHLTTRSGPRRKYGGPSRALDASPMARATENWTDDRGRPRGTRGSCVRRHLCFNRRPPCPR